MIENNIIYEIIDEDLFLASADLKNVKEDNIVIPLQVFIERDYNSKVCTVIEIKNIGNKNIVISKYLKNKYIGKNITYIDTKSPYIVNRTINLMNLKYDKIKSYYKKDFMDCCETIYYNTLKYDSDFLSEKLNWNNELKTMFTNDEINNKYNIGSIMKYVADIDLIKHIIIPYKNEIRNIFNCAKDSWPEQKMKIFEIYEKCKNDMISRTFWSKNLIDLPTDIKIISRGNYETI